MSKFYVVSGYCGPDHYTSTGAPALKVTEFATATEVERFYRDFVENRDDDDSHVTFRVFEGAERKMVSVERVTEYKLQ